MRPSEATERFDPGCPPAFDQSQPLDEHADVDQWSVRSSPAPAAYRHAPTGSSFTTPGPRTEAMFESVLAGTRPPTASVGVDIEVRPALSATAGDVLADAYLLGTPANIGYMSGAPANFFDQIYHLTRKATTGRPYGLAVHGNEGLEDALRSVESVTKGLGGGVPATGGGAW